MKIISKNREIRNNVKDIIIKNRKNFIWDSELLEMLQNIDPNIIKINRFMDNKHIVLYKKDNKTINIYL